MRNYRHGSHTTFSIYPPIVRIMQYRYKALRGVSAERVRTLVREACQKAKVDILQGHISPDHGHAMTSIPPHVPSSRLIQGMQGRSS
jgi:putative transposase